MVNVEALNGTWGNNTFDNKALKKIVESISSPKSNSFSLINLIETTGAGA